MEHVLGDSSLQTLYALTSHRRQKTSVTLYVGAPTSFTVIVIPASVDSIILRGTKAFYFETGKQSVHAV